MQYVIFENAGTLDPRAITTLGINAKPGNDSAIGFFGTGLKYAVAVCAREGVGFDIQWGDGDATRYTSTVTKLRENFRDKEFEFLALDHYNDTTGDIAREKLAYTTEFGKNWQMWQVIRELESNVRDEGGSSYRSDTVPTPEKGIVRIILTGDKALEAYRKINEIFYDLKFGPAPIKEIGVELHMRESTHVYYRNIMVLSADRPFVNAYNFTKIMNLTEDRTLKYYWVATSAVQTMLLQTSNKELLRRTLTLKGRYRIGLNHDAGYIEDALDFGGFDLSDYPVFWEVVQELFGDSGVQLNSSIMQYMFKHNASKRNFEDARVDQLEEAMLERAKSICDELDLVWEKYPIKVVRQLPNNAYGQCDLSGDVPQIYLSKHAFDHGWQCVAGTLVEEVVHASFGHKDESRELQDYLLRQLINQTWRTMEAGEDA